MRIHFWKWRLFFEPRDIWVGVYWKRFPQALDLYICVLPMLPLYIYVQWERPPSPAAPGARRNNMAICVFCGDLLSESRCPRCFKDIEREVEASTVAAIVAWLRGKAARDVLGPPTDGTYDDCDALADAIERGDWKHGDKR